MPTFEEIYRSHAQTYDQLVSREDHQGNILSTLRRICPLEGMSVLELGAGTGRLSKLIAPLTQRLIISDLSPAMLQMAVSALDGQTQTQNPTAALIANNDALPLCDQAVEVVLAGWSLGHTIGWYPDSWPERIRRTLEQMRRVTRPGGMLIIIETLGTGFEVPTPPPILIPYYDLLKEMGFSQTWCRTDYRFETLSEAETLTRFFFGDSLATEVVQKSWLILPECTGFWWKRV